MHEWDCGTKVGGWCTCGDNDPRSDVERQIMAVGNLVGFGVFVAIMLMVEHCG